MKSLFSNTETQESKNAITNRKEKNEMSPTIAPVLCLEVILEHGQHREMQSWAEETKTEFGSMRCLEFATSSARKEELYRKNFRIPFKSMPEY